MAADVTRWFGLFKQGDPLWRVSNHTRVNRVSRVLGGWQGLGCRIEKPLDGEGSGWLVIVGDGSDVELPDGFVPVDRKFALGDSDVPGTFTAKVANKTATPSDTNSILVSWEVDGDDKANFHIPIEGIADSTSGITHILGLDSSGSVYLVPTTDTCA